MSGDNLRFSDFEKQCKKDKFNLDGCNHQEKMWTGEVMLTILAAAMMGARKEKIIELLRKLADSFEKDLG